MNPKPTDAVQPFRNNPAARRALGLEPIDPASDDLGPAEPVPFDAERALLAGRRLAERGMHREAERAFRQVLEHAPGRTEAAVGLALLLLETGRKSEALVALDHALDSDPGRPELHLLAASAQERMGAFAEAAHHLTAVLNGEPDHLEANRRLATILARFDDSSAAIPCWRRVVARTGGGDLEALAALGIALSSDGQHREAIEVLTGLAARQPRESAAQSNLGMALYRARRLDDALPVFTRALALDRRAAPAYCGLGLVHQALAQWNEAVEAFTATEQLAPENPAGPLNLALALEKLGDREGAQAAVLRAAALAPEDTAIRGALQRFRAETDRQEPPATVPHEEDFGVAISGDLGSFQLFDLLEFLRLQSKTGSLVLSSRHGAGLVRLVGGAITSASAPGVKRLGEALVERNLLKRAQLEQTLRRQRGQEAASAEALGTVLLREGVLDRAQLSKVVLGQILEAITQLNLWSDGAFSFHSREAGDPPALSFSVQQVILELARTSDERDRDRAGASG